MRFCGALPGEVALDLLQRLAFRLGQQEGRREMVDEGEGGVYIRQFQKLFGRLSDTRHALDSAKRLSRLDTLSFLPLAGSGIAMLALTLSIMDIMGGMMDESLLMEGEGTSVSDIDGEYVAVLHIEDEISQSSSFWYDHYYLLDTIDDLIADDNNKGIVFYMDTPGGSVYATDEMYLAVKDYQEKTNRPVYTYMASMAASGGYYIAAPSDKIYINRNGVTGSIGVTMGNYIDVSELLAKYGVKVNTITSGRNKAMGSELVPMTDEQKAILQSIVDEAYEQFTAIVAEGRGMDIEKVKELADGRIYTALQAKANGLVDEVGTYDDLCDAFLADNGLDASVQIVDFWPPQMSELDSFLNRFMSTDFSPSGMLTADQIEELLSLNGKIELKYMYGE